MDQTTRPDLRLIDRPRCVVCNETEDIWMASALVTIEGDEHCRAMVPVCAKCVDTIPSVVARMVMALGVDSIARGERNRAEALPAIVCDRCGERARAAQVIEMQNARRPSEQRQVVRLELPASLDSTGLAELLERSLTELAHIPTVSLSHASTWLTQAAGSMGQQSPAIGKAMLHAARIVYVVADALRR